MALQYGQQPIYPSITTANINHVLPMEYWVSRYPNVPSRLGNCDDRQEWDNYNAGYCFSRAIDILSLFRQEKDTVFERHAYPQEPR